MNHITTLLLFLSTTLCFGQTGSLKGKITQADNSTPLAGVHIALEKTELGGFSNGNGTFVINGIPAGTVTLVVSSIGFASRREEVSIRENETTTINLTLTESIAQLSEVMVMTHGATGMKEIPGAVQYVTLKDLEKFNYTDVGRTLRSIPGVNFQDEDGFGLRPNIGLRGSGVERSSKITLMEDGVLMAPAPYADPAAYYFPTVGRMQALEVLKGSSQIKYGPYTTGGAINLISTQIPDHFSGKLSITGGSFGGRNVHAYAGNSHQNVSYLVETFQYGSDGFKQLDGGGNTGFDKKDYLAKLSFNTNPSAKVYQSIMFKVGQANEDSNETYLGLTEEDYEDNPIRRYAGSQKDLMTTEQTQFSIHHTARFSESLSLSTTVYRSDFKRNWYKLDQVREDAATKVAIADLLDNPNDYANAYAFVTGTTSPFADALIAKANNRSYYARGIQTEFNYAFGNAVSHDLTIGLRVHEDEVDRFQWQDEYTMNEGVMQLTKAGQPGTESNRIKSANAFATYLQYKVRFGKFLAVPGLRYENIRMDEKNFGKNDPGRTGSQLTTAANQVGVFIPGIGLDYQFTTNLSGFGGIHKGFSPPGALDETRPEESVNYELGVRYFRGTLSVQATTFFNDYSNLLGADLAAGGGNGTGDLFNAGAARSKGLEFQLSYDLIGSNETSEFSFPVTIAYTFTDAEFLDTFASTNEDWGTVDVGDEFPYLAHHQFSVMLGVLYKKWSVNLSSRYMDAMRTAPGQGEIPANEKTDSYLLTDLSGSFAMHKNISVFAGVLNITDDTYLVARRPAGLRPGLPRSFTFGVKAFF
jgi:Fe(3+) dicitrate transport protein